MPPCGENFASGCSTCHIRSVGFPKLETSSRTELMSSISGQRRASRTQTGQYGILMDIGGSRLIGKIIGYVETSEIQRKGPFSLLQLPPSVPPQLAQSYWRMSNHFFWIRLL